MESFAAHSQKGIMVVFSGPSGAGKNSIISSLIEADVNRVHSISLTTREPRPHEVNGVSYHFTTREHFETLIRHGDVLEYDEYCGSFYGTPREPVFQYLNEGKDVLLDLTVAGALQIREKCPDAILVFIMPPSIQELVSRLSTRGTESEDALAHRVETAKQELRMAVKFDYCVENAKLEDAVNDITAIMRAEKCRVSRLCIDGRLDKTV
ncbi:MAG: guanylate kinase [Clostridiaceae bacterium]|jgi:guanylate kinase|nr:guanylate kinase [Clostridiaceae bacterium]